MNSGDQPQNLTSYQPQPKYEDEISLVEIITVLLRRKNLIFWVTAIVVCLGLFYAFAQQRVYHVETILLPPSFENIQPLNVLNNRNINSSNINSSNVNSSNVFAGFTRNINSRKLKKEFFVKFNLLETLSSKPIHLLTDKQKNNYFEFFSKSLTVKFDKKTSSTHITLEGTYQDKIGPWLDSFVVMANVETINQLVRNLEASINSKIGSLKIDISSKRSIYKKIREDELARLEEAFQIAKSLKIHEHLFVPNVDNKSRNAVAAELNSISNRLSNANNLSSYMKGTKVLQAEINALKNRKSDDIHIHGLRDLQEQLTRLESIQIEKNKLRAVIVDKKAVVNIEPIRPNRMLVVILSFIMAGIIGIFAVFIIEFISRVKKQVDNINMV